MDRGDRKGAGVLPTWRNCGQMPDTICWQRCCERGPTSSIRAAAVATQAVSATDTAGRITSCRAAASSSGSIEDVPQPAAAIAAPQQHGRQQQVAPRRRQRCKPLKSLRWPSAARTCTVAPGLRHSRWDSRPTRRQPASNTGSMLASPRRCAAALFSGVSGCANTASVCSRQAGRQAGRVGVGTPTMLEVGQCRSGTASKLQRPAGPLTLITSPTRVLLLLSGRGLRAGGAAGAAAAAARVTCHRRCPRESHSAAAGGSKVRGDLECCTAACCGLRSDAGSGPCWQLRLAPPSPAHPCAMGGAAARAARARGPPRACGRCSCGRRRAGGPPGRARRGRGAT